MQPYPTLFGWVRTSSRRARLALIRRRAIALGLARPELADEAFRDELREYKGEDRADAIVVSVVVRRLT